jgi:prevent-host-death family protein
MSAIGVRELGRNPSKVLDELAEGRRPILITRRGRPVAVLTPIDPDEVEDQILAHAPEFVAGRAEADADLREGRTVPLSKLLAEHGEE